MYDNIARYTTSELRNEALHAEIKCNWGAAASYWLAAITNYPNPVGSLAKLDIDKMQKRAASCEHTAKVAAARA